MLHHAASQAAVARSTASLCARFRCGAVHPLEGLRAAVCTDYEVLLIATGTSVRERLGAATEVTADIIEATGDREKHMRAGG